MNEKRDVWYIGRFPPPLGGVTIKNDILFSELNTRIHVKRVSQNEKRLGFSSALSVLFNLLIPNRCFIIGISASRKSSLVISTLLFCFNRYSMKRSLYFMMGGQEAVRIANKAKERSIWKCYKHIYVETDSMKECLDNVGFTNVSVFPNCRIKPKKEFIASSITGPELCCVFFSGISKEKGADLVIEAAEKLPNIRFDFYGRIDQQYRADFLSRVEELNNCKYLGIFVNENGSVYDTLHNYDALLFPSRWITEGVPGVLVEAKIAGVPAIVSNISHNGEIVTDGVDGILLSENTSEALVSAVQFYDKNRAALLNAKVAARKSSESYDILSYIDGIVSKLQE